MRLVEMEASIACGRGRGKMEISDIQSPSDPAAGFQIQCDLCV